jgi:potassium-transporting ATPase KdpC subunit
MMRHLSKSILLMVFAVAICCGLYPLTLWVIGQTFFHDQANGSLIRDAAGTVVGSRLIAQPFTKDEYFHPRPSAPSYDASASAPSNLAASNYALRARVAGTIGPIATYASGAQAGQPVGPDIEAWFQQDRFGGEPHIVAQWADAHNSLAQAWVKADPSHAAYVDEWSKGHPAVVAQWVKDNPDTPEPQAADLAVVFFDSFSNDFPGRFPAAVEHQTADGKTESSIEPVKDGADIQSTFFDMWRQEHPDVALQDVPADLVMASGSGLDPHITLDNAKFQLDRVASAWAQDTKRDQGEVRRDIEALIQQKAFAPGGGLFGVPMVNVLELNLELRKRYGEPGGSAA